MLRVRKVFFDAVGTLLFPHPSPLEVYAAVGRDAGLHLPIEQLRARYQAAFRQEEERDRQQQWLTSEERERDRWRAIVAATLAGVPDVDACFERLWHHFAQPLAWQVPSEAEPLLITLHRLGYSLGLASNFDQRLFHVVQGQPALALLREAVIISSQVGFRKPSPRFFAALGPESLYVGDDISNDYEGAKSAGLPAILFDPQDRSPQIPHRILSLAELADPEKVMNRKPGYQPGCSRPG